MRHIWTTMIGLFGVYVVCLTTSCTKQDINGDLDGFWQLRSIEYTSNDSIVNVQDSLRFMAIQLDLLELRNNQESGCFARFKHKDDSLSIWMIDSTSIKESWMSAFGMDSTIQHFYVELLNKKHLILRSNFTRLTWHKF